MIDTEVLTVVDCSIFILVLDVFIYFSQDFRRGSQSLAECQVGGTLKHSWDVGLCWEANFLQKRKVALVCFWNLLRKLVICTPSCKKPCCFLLCSPNSVNFQGFFVCSWRSSIKRVLNYQFLIWHDHKTSQYLEDFGKDRRLFFTIFMCALIS